MVIQVALKHPGNLRKGVQTQPFFLARTPETFGELMEEVVRTSLALYQNREDREEPFCPLSDAEAAGMAEVGKFAWLLPVETRAVSYPEALRTAKEAIRDGLVRVFQNERELTEPDAPLTLGEDDVFTFVRLTFLTGRMW